MINHICEQPLSDQVSLCVYDSDTLIFSSKGKWLMPLFECERFFMHYTGSREQLSAHDTAVGKAAAVLMVRLGIRRIHADLASDCAKAFIDSLNSIDGAETVLFSWKRKVPRLLCATENQLSTMSDINEMYAALRVRAHLVRGVSVEADHLSCAHGMIHDVSFQISPGDRLAVIGENGTGKTTLLRHLAGILKPVSGSVRINGKNPAQLPAMTIGYVPQQQDNRLFSLSVEEVISIGIAATGKKRVLRIQDVMKRTDCIGLAGRDVSTLSGGERQKVSLARCLAQQAKVLLLDEPTSALDSYARTMITDILKSLSVHEMPTIILVTHDADLITNLGWSSIKLGPAA